MPSFNDYQGQLQSYMNSAPGQWQGDTGQPLEYTGGSAAANADQTRSGGLYQGWLNSLSPEQRNEYLAQQNAQFAKGTQRGRLAFGLATGAMGGLGALYSGAGELGAGAGSLADAAGASAETFPSLQMSTSLASPGTYAAAPAFADTAEPLALQASSTLSPSSLAAIGAGNPGGAQFGSPEQRAMDYSEGYGNTDNVTPATPTGTGTNPYLDTVKQVLGISGTPSVTNIPQGLKFASNLASLYDTYQNKRRNQTMANNLTSLYGPDSPYAFQLNKALTRAYAASGRRSDIGGRNVELQAKLAEMNSHLAPTLNTINNQQRMYNNRFLYSGLQGLDQMGAFRPGGFIDKGINGLAGLFGG